MTRIRLVPLAIRLAVAATVAVSGYVHAKLYVDGYRFISPVGPMFLLQAAVSFALATLLVFAAPLLVRVAAAGTALGALGGFVLSRTVGMGGFTEHGFQPHPQHGYPQQPQGYPQHPQQQGYPQGYPQQQQGYPGGPQQGFGPGPQGYPQGQQGYAQLDGDTVRLTERGWAAVGAGRAALGEIEAAWRARVGTERFGVFADVLAQLAAWQAGRPAS